MTDDEIKQRISELKKAKSEILTELHALNAQLAEVSAAELLAASAAKRRKRCLVLELHISGMSQMAVSKLTGIPYHSLIGYLYQSEGDYSWALRIDRSEGWGKATFWRQHKLKMALLNLQCAYVGIRRGGKLEDVKDPDSDVYQHLFIER